MSLEQVSGKLKEIETRYDELVAQMNDPEVCSDHQRYRLVAKSKGDMEDVALAYRKYRSIIADIPVAEEMLSGADADEREIAQEELETLKRQKEEIEETIRVLLLDVANEPARGFHARLSDIETETATSRRSGRLEERVASWISMAAR